MTLKASNQIIPFQAKEGKSVLAPSGLLLQRSWRGWFSLLCRKQRAEACSTKTRALTPGRDLPSLSFPSPVGHQQASTLTRPPGCRRYSGLEPCPYPRPLDPRGTPGSKLGSMEEASVDRPRSVPGDPSPWASPPARPAPLAPVSSLPSSPVLCSSHLGALPPPRRPCPRGLARLAGGVRSALPAPGRARPRRAPPAPHIRTAAAGGGREAARGRIPHSRFGVCWQLPGNPALVLPPSPSIPQHQRARGPSFARDHFPA